MITRRHLLGTAGAGLAVCRIRFTEILRSRSCRRSAHAGRAGRRRQLRDHGHAAGQEAADPAFRPAAELRGAARISAHADHAERPVLCPLSPLGHPGSQSRRLQDRGRRRRRQRPGRDHARRPEENAGRRGRRGQPVLRQPARPVEAACARRGMGLRRHGLRALEGRPAQGRARQGRPEEGGDRNRLQRRRRPGRRQTPDFIKSIPVWKAIDESTSSPTR